MTKPNIIVPDFPDLPEGYGPDVVYGPIKHAEHVFFLDGIWQTSNDWSCASFWHAYKREPVQRVVYVNVYPGKGYADVVHPTRESADGDACPNRIARVRVEFVEGQFDD